MFGITEAAPESPCLCGHLGAYLIGFDSSIRRRYGNGRNRRPTLPVPSLFSGNHLPPGRNLSYLLLADLAPTDTFLPIDKLLRYSHASRVHSASLSAW